MPINGKIIAGVVTDRKEDKVLRQCLREGRIAYRSGIPNNRNPHPKGTKENAAWDAGWKGTPFSVEEAIKA